MFAFLICGALNAMNFYLFSYSLALPNYYVSFYFFLTQGALAWLWIDFTLIQFEQPVSQAIEHKQGSRSAQGPIFQGDPAHPSK